MHNPSAAGRRVNQPSAEEGAVLLLVYVLGLGVPFLAFGLAFTRAPGLTRALRRRWQVELIRLTSLRSRFTGLTV
jgi:cytochrome c biogenesis protein CcdA